MKAFKTLLLASTLVAGGALAAQAQSSTTPSASGSANVSAATHCKDSSGKIQMKSAMSGKNGAGTTGTANSGTASGTSSGSTAGTGAAPSNAPAASAASGSAANLPSC
jgi:hypothetical protein